MVMMINYCILMSMKEEKVGKQSANALISKEWKNESALKKATTETNVHNVTHLATKA